MRVQVRLGRQKACLVEAVALEQVRTTRLIEMEPWFQRLQGKTAIETRVVLLERAGVTLTGEYGDGWLKSLENAAGGNNGPAVAHALYLIEQIVAEKRCKQFASFPTDQRRRALAAYLDDIGRTNR